MLDVVVVAPIRLHREGLSLLLDATESINVVGMAASVVEAVPRARQLNAEVAVLDAPKPADVELHGPARAKDEMKLVAIGVPEREAARWLAAGASGCVAPEASVEDVAAAVADVARGVIAVSPEVTASLLGRTLGSVAETSMPSTEARLTRREREVIDLVAQGLANKQIAVRLSIREQTVKNHVHNILVKLDAQNRIEAAVLLKARTP